MGWRQDLKADLLEAYAGVHDTLAEIRAAHYARNDRQGFIPGYAEVVLGTGWQLASDAASSLHRFDLPGDAGNGDNSKWLGPAGRELVYRYVGSAASGGFELVDSPRNQGTFNFVPASESATGHLLYDVNPWILWGNSRADAQTWSARDRLEALPKASVDGAFDSLWDFATRVTRTGGDGDDTFTGATRSQSFVGGDGADTVTYGVKATGAVTLDLAQGLGFDGKARGDTYDGIENIVGTRYGDIIGGNDSDNRLEGGAGHDFLLGVDGDDTLIGGRGGDTMIGGDGDDTFRLLGGDEAWGGAGDDVFQWRPRGATAIDGGTGGVDVLDLRGFNLARIRLPDMTEIEEIWTDSPYLNKTANADARFGEDMVIRVFGTHDLTVRQTLAAQERYLMGGAEVRFADDAALTVAFDSKADPKRARFWNAEDQGILVSRGRTSSDFAMHEEIGISHDRIIAEGLPPLDHRYLGMELWNLSAQFRVTFDEGNAHTRASAGTTRSEGVLLTAESGTDGLDLVLHSVATASGDTALTTREGEVSPLQSDNAGSISYAETYRRPASATLHADVLPEDLDLMRGDTVGEMLAVFG